MKTATKGITARGLFEVMRFALPLMAVMAGVVAFLFILKLVPPAIEKEEQTFATIDQAEKAIGRKVVLPAYFPDFLSWPPSQIRGKGQPNAWIALSVNSGEQKDALTIEEWFFPQTEPSPPKVPSIEKTQTQVDGTAASLLVWQEGGVTYRRIYWTEGGMLVSITSLGSLEELSKIAQSVHP